MWTKHFNEVETIPLEAEVDEDAEMPLSRQEAIEVIQKNERGRQGKQRALLVKDLRDEESKRRLYDADGTTEIDPEDAVRALESLSDKCCIRTCSNTPPALRRLYFF